MNFTRRNFVKGVCAAVGVMGMGGLFQGEAAHAARKSPVGDKKVGIEWLGHGSFVFTSCAGMKILLDPWISTNPKCPGKYKADKAFGKVDLVLWTHGHVDHFMLPDAKKIIAEYAPKVVAPWELSFFIKTEIPMADTQTFTLGNKGATAAFDGVKVTMVEAVHSSGAQLTGFKGTNLFVGEAVGYIMEFENGLKVYHSGDTSLFGDMRHIIGEYYRPHVAILPIGGVFTMGPAEAAFACKLIQPEVVLPEHYGTFPVLEQSADGFKQALGTHAPRVRALVAEPGKGVFI